MKTIWKFPLTIASHQTIEIPIKSHFLHLGVDGDGVRCLWFAVDPGSTMTEMEIITVGTGWELPHVGDFLGTLIGRDGLVWHFFCGPDSSVNKQVSFHYQTQEN